MKIIVLHNVNRDASFGLNMMLDRAGKFPEPRSHELVRVFEFEVSESEDPDIAQYTMTLLDVVFRMLNVGHIDGMEGERGFELATAYRARRLRSLSVGDVLVIDGRHYACASAGWDEFAASEVRVLSARAAELVVRRRFGFGPGEELALSVPLDD